MTTAQLCLLQPCNSHQSHKNMLSPAENTSKVPSNLSSEAMHLNSVDNDTQVDVLERSTISDVPTPEQFLSLPEGLTSAPSDLPLTSTPDKEVLGGDGPGTKFLSGKKCSYTESTGTVHSSNSVESFGEAREKRTANSIPDDDDLLSSILVGRRSSVLKLKPTLPIPETMSIKRSRTATRGTASKRKVLMDDTMVVHGEYVPSIHIIFYVHNLINMSFHISLLSFAIKYDLLSIQNFDAIFKTSTSYKLSHFAELLNIILCS